MKNTIYIYLLLSLLSLLFVACNSNEKRQQSSRTATTIIPKSKSSAKTSADYSTLLVNYECNMDVAEVAKVLEIPESDLSISEQTIPGKCRYNLKGFGKQAGGYITQLIWGTAPSSKGQNRKEIAGYLEREKENTNFMGMGIELAETGDCYLAFQPAHGRVIIYNEQYDKAFLINYGYQYASITGRTDEQHEVLKEKMTDLANYLLKKHRK